MATKRKASKKAVKKKATRKKVGKKVSRAGASVIRTPQKK